MRLDSERKIHYTLAECYCLLHPYERIGDEILLQSYIQTQNANCTECLARFEIVSSSSSSSLQLYNVRPTTP
jgi:hypothetical protein